MIRAGVRRRFTVATTQAAASTEQKCVTDWKTVRTAVTNCHVVSSFCSATRPHT